MMSAQPVLGEWLYTQAMHAPFALITVATVLWFTFMSGHLPYEQIRDGSRLFRLLRPHSRYHNRHHREFYTHYAFSLVWLDRWLGGSRVEKP